MKKFYVISFDDGSVDWAVEADYISTLNHAEYMKGDREYTIEEYESYEDYINNL